MVRNSFELKIKKFCISPTKYPQSIAVMKKKMNKRISHNKSKNILSITNNRNDKKQIKILASSLSG